MVNYYGYDLGEIVRWRAILLSCIGVVNYRILKDLCFPEKPSEKTYGDLTAQLKQHFKPKCLAVAEHFRFHGTKQKPGETIADIVTNLRKSVKPG